MSPAITDSFIVGCIVLVVAVAGFFGREWFTGLKSSVDSLNISINSLTNTISSFGTTQAVHAERIEQHNEAIKELWGLACQNPECPFRGDRRRSG